MTSFSISGNRPARYQQQQSIQHRFDFDFDFVFELDLDLDLDLDLGVDFTRSLEIAYIVFRSSLQLSTLRYYPSTQVDPTYTLTLNTTSLNICCPTHRHQHKRSAKTAQHQRAQHKHQR